MITLERRPFKQFESIAAAGVTRPEAVRGNPTSLERLPTKRDFKRLESVADLPDDNDPLNCTTRYFDSAGNQLWHKNHGATVRDVGLDSSGNVYEVGDAASGVTLRKRRASDGRILWSRSHGAALNSLAVTSDGGVVVGGLAGTGGATVRKYSADGVLLWSGSTTAKVIKVAVDELDAVAALESLDSSVWNALIYAFSSAGVAGETQQYGGLGSSQYTYPTAIAFGGTVYRNTAPYQGTFYNQLLIGFTQYVPLLARTQSQVSLQEGFGSAIGFVGDDGMPIAYPSRLHDVCISHANTAGEMSYWAVATAQQVIARNQYTTDTVMKLAFYYPRGISPTDPAYYDRITASDMLSVFGTSQFLFTGATVFQRFSLSDPLPNITFTGRLWRELPDWQYNHHGTIWGCHALESGASVMGGAVATV